MKIVKKKWGHEEWIVDTEGYCGKRLILNPGHRSSLHYHREKDETFYVDEGRILLEHQLPDGTLQGTILSVHDSYRVLPGIAHRFRTLEDLPTIIAIVYEFSTHHDDDDVVRLEESE